MHEDSEPKSPTTILSSPYQTFDIDFDAGKLGVKSGFKEFDSSVKSHDPSLESKYQTSEQQKLTNKSEGIEPIQKQSLIKITVLDIKGVPTEDCKLKAMFGKEKYIFRRQQLVDGTCIHVADLNISESVPKEIEIEVSDKTRSRHDFNGKLHIDTENLLEAGALDDIWVPLESEDCEILINAELIDHDGKQISLKPDSITADVELVENKSVSSQGPLSDNSVSGVSKLTLVQAKELIKKDIFSKSDPYAVISFNSKSLKTDILKNTHEPEWNFEFEIPENSKSGTDINFHIYNKKTLAKDDSLGHFSFNSSELFHHMRIISKWYNLNGVKAGKVLLNGEFIPDSKNEHTTPEELPSEDQKPLEEGKLIFELIKGRNLKSKSKGRQKILI